MGGAHAVAVRDGRQPLDVRAEQPADHLGLGLTVAALMLQADSWRAVFKLGLIWGMVLVASSTVGFLLANEAHRRGQEPWTRRVW